MPKKPLKILAINPGTRYLGIAVFQGHDLIDWGGKVIKGKWSKRKLKKIKEIFSSLIHRYEPNILTIKRLHPSRSSGNLKLLVGRLKQFAKRKRLKVYQYSIKEVEAFFSPDERLNKKKLAEVMASRYPELFPELEKEKTHKNPYHLRMFEAVALGSRCFHQLDKLCRRTTQKS